MPLSTGEFKDQIHKRLRVRLILYFVISIALICISLFHIVTDHANWGLSLIGFGLGAFVGIVVSRMFKISWDDSAGQVISAFDVGGVVILVLYIFFAIFRERIVEYFVSGPSLVAVSFAVLAGTMYGRVLGIRGKIRDIFEKEGVV